MIPLHEIITGNNFDLLLVVLGFAVGQGIKFKEEIYLTIFILRIMRWGLHTLPDKEQFEIREKIDAILDRLSIKHKPLPLEDEMAG